MVLLNPREKVRGHRKNRESHLFVSLFTQTWFFFHVLQKKYYCTVKLWRKLMQAISCAWGIDPPLSGSVLRHALPLPNHTAVLHWGFIDKSWDAQWLRQPGESTACRLFKCCDKVAVQAVIPSFGGIPKIWHITLPPEGCILNFFFEGELMCCCFDCCFDSSL